MNDLKEWLKYLRIIFFAALLVFALTKFRALYDQLKVHEFVLHKTLIIVFFVLISFVVQAVLTKKITSFCGGQIKIHHALKINMLGGLWGVLLPFGSVAYKAVYLKNHHHIEMLRYSSFYGLSFLASTVASLLLVSVSSLYYSVYDLLVLSLALLSCIAVFFIVIEPLGKGFPRLQGVNVLKSLFDRERKKIFIHFLILHFFGLFNYILIYQSCFYFLELSIPFVQSCALVAIQNILFLAPLVPGNFVVLELVAAWLMNTHQTNPYDVVLAVLIMRFVMLACLLVMSLLCLIIKNPTENKTQSGMK